MADPVMMDLGYDVAGQLVASVGGADVGVAAVDLAGHVYWHNDVTIEREVGRAIVETVQAGVRGDEVGRDLGDRGRLLLNSIRDSAGSPKAWLAVWCDEVLDCAPLGESWKRVGEVLPKIASVLSRECALAHELAGAVQDLGNRYEELNIVYRMERAARSSDRHDDVVQSMLDGFLSHLRIDVGVLMAQVEGKCLRGRGTMRPIENVDLVITELEGKVWRFIGASRKPLVINDADDPRREYLLTNMPFKVLAFPNEACEGPNAGLVLLRGMDEPDFSNSDMSLARVFFGQAMILLRNRALLSKMEHFTRQIASSLVETVEAKDPYTRGHSERVEQITGRIGHEAGVPENDQADLLWGALLHDIGKIGVPDAILMKPGKLTADEFTFIKTHPDRSFEILRHVEALGPAALDGARYHQERFDGGGYPYGLAGVEIPLVARVVAVADTYDAVTSSRSYRAAATHEEAMEVIANVSGTQLDPDLVRLFQQLVTEDQSWLDAIRPHHIAALDG